MLPRNLLCFSPYRWDNKMYRPQQLMARFADEINVYYFEDPVFDTNETSYLSFSTRSETLWKIVPHLPPHLTVIEITDALKELLNGFLKDANLNNWMFWHYTSMPLQFTKKCRPRLVVYDYVVEFEKTPTNWDEVFEVVHKQIHKELSVSSIIEVMH